MGHEGFFSYDLLATGALGLEVFFLTTELILLFFAVSVLGVLIPALKWLFLREFKLSDWSMAGCLLVVNVLTWLRLSSALNRAASNEFSVWVVLIALSVLICFHLAVLLHRPPKDGFRSLMGVLITLLGLTTVAHTEMVSLLQLGLKHFGVGGEIPVTVKFEGSGAGEVKAGKLTLLSPEHAYVVLDGETNLSIIPRSRAEIIQISSKNTLSKK